MGVGKYSPTVSAAYGADQEWHRKLLVNDEQYDDEGYDRYGYNWPEEKDRAGNTEWDYLSTFETNGNDFCYSLYEWVLGDWTFDGVRPVERK
jgi:hypothetical protein